MKQGKYAAPVRRRRRRNTLKPMLIAMAVVLLLGCVTGGTLAWLTAKTDKVVNTFTVGDINIDLAESPNLDLKMIPGHTITKDPVVTVKANSEKCYLFIKVTESDNFDDFMSYAVIETTDDVPAWNKVTGQDGVYYRVVEASNADQTFNVLVNNQVTVKDSVTKSDMNGLTTTTEDDKIVTNYPTLTFQAAAVQYYRTNDVEFGVTAALAEITWG